MTGGGGGAGRTGGGGKERFCFCILLDRGLPLTFKSKCRLRKLLLFLFT